MNQEQAKKLLPIIQAFAEGKQIQCTHSYGNWVDCPRPEWRVEQHYRIKPEKKTGWVNCYPTGSGSMHPTKNHADTFRSGDCVACIQITYEEGEGL